MEPGTRVLENPLRGFSRLYWETMGNDGSKKPRGARLDGAFWQNLGVAGNLDGPWQDSRTKGRGALRDDSEFLCPQKYPQKMVAVNSTGSISPIGEVLR